MHDIARRGHQGNALCSRRRGIHEVQPRSGGRCLCRLQHVDVGDALADLLQIPQRLLLDRRQTALDIAFCRLAVGEIRCLVRQNDLVLVGLPNAQELLAHLRRRRARLAEVFRAGQFGGLAEDAVDTLWHELVIEVADRRARSKPRGGIGFTAFRRYPQLGQRALFTQLRAGGVDEFLCLARSRRDGLDVAVLLDREARYGFAGLGDAVDDLLRPAWLDADDYAGSHVRIRPRTDHGSEMEIEVRAELQPPIGVRQGDGTLYVVGDGLAGGIRDIVHGQYGHVIAYSDAAVLAPETPESSVSTHNDALLTNAWSSGCVRGRVRPSAPRSRCALCSRHT